MSKARAQTADAAPSALHTDSGGIAPTPSRDSEAASHVAEIAPRIEALLISVDRALPAQRIAEAVSLVPHSQDGDDAAPATGKEVARAVRVVADAIKLLNDQYQATARTFRIEELSAGYRVMTLPAFAAVVADFHKARQQTKLSRAAVESLAIIAYKQPITRAELEAIRGVSCGEVLKTLLERRLITIRGRAEELGRPMLYGTTKQFLDTFGLSSIKDLPAPADLKI